MHRRQIGIRKVTVILSIFLGAHGKRTPLLIVPPAGLLFDPLSFFKQLQLTFGFRLYGTGDGLERIEIFHFGTRAKGTVRITGIGRRQPICSFNPGGRTMERPDRQVDIRAKRSFIHPTVGHPEET